MTSERHAFEKCGELGSKEHPYHKADDLAAEQGIPFDVADVDRVATMSS